MNDEQERGQYVAMAAAFRGCERPRWLTQRFQALDLLHAKGEPGIAVLRSTNRLEPERGWSRVLRAAGLEEEAVPVSPARRAGHVLGPETPAHRVAVLLGLRAGERPVALAHRLGLARDVVDRALRYLARWGAVRHRGGRWWPVREQRPW